MKVSARNKLAGIVREIHLGGVIALVKIDVGDNLIEAVITQDSVEDMGLKAGDRVTALVKSTSVMVMK